MCFASSVLQLLDRAPEAAVGAERLSSTSSVSSSTTTTPGTRDDGSQPARKLGAVGGASSSYGNYGRVFDPHPRLHWKINVENPDEAQAAVLERLNMSQQVQQVRDERRSVDPFFFSLFNL